MLSNISAVQLGIVLLIVILIFGTKRLRNMGEDIGGGIKGLRKGFEGQDLADAAREVGGLKKSLEDVRAEVMSPSESSTKSPKSTDDGIELNEWAKESSGSSSRSSDWS